MKEKDLNQAILNELYGVADEIWSLMRKRIAGSFTAREIVAQKHLGRDMFFGEGDYDKTHHVEVGNFRCSFQSQQIFYLLDKFESLAGVGSRRRLFVAENKGNVEGSVTFAVTKELEELCDFTGYDPLRPALAFIFVDAARKCLVATNSFVMKVCPVEFSRVDGDTSDIRILAADFKKMCAKMKGKNVYDMTATKERTGDGIYTNVMYEGIASSASHEYVFPEWFSVFPDCSSELSFNVQDWAAVNKVAKKGKYDFIQVIGKRGDKTVQFLAGKCEAQVEVGEELKHSFSLLFSAKQFSIVKKAESMCFYLGEADHSTVQAVDSNGNVYLFQPKVVDDITTFVGEFVEGILVGHNAECDINLLDRYLLNKVSFGEASTAKKQAPKAVAKKAENPETKKQVATSRKFTFAAIGVQSGDKLTFVDGREVVAVDGNKVAYEGSIYTLSGFCATFMPEEKRTKSNSYRGCAFFYIGGVKLAKLFSDALAVNDQPAESVENETTEETATTEKNHEDVRTETKTENQVVVACAETDVEIQDVNACAEENHAALPLCQSAPAALPMRRAAPPALPMCQSAPAALPIRRAAPPALPMRRAAPPALPMRRAAPPALPMRRAAPAALPMCQSAPAALPMRLTAPAALPMRRAAPAALPMCQSAPAALPMRRAAPPALPMCRAAPPALPMCQSAPAALPMRRAAPPALPMCQSAPAALPMRLTAPAALLMRRAAPPALPMCQSAPAALPMRLTAHAALPMCQSAPAALPMCLTAPAALPLRCAASAALPLCRAAPEALPHVLRRTRGPTL